MGADIRAPPATGKSPMTAGRRLTVTLEFLMNPPRLLVKTLTSPVSLYSWLRNIMKKLAKTNIKVTGSMQVSNSTVVVPEIPRDRKLIRNAARVSEMPKPTRRYIKTTNRTIETAKTSSGLRKLT
jgi:hypothetical protein